MRNLFSIYILLLCLLSHTFVAQSTDLPSYKFKYYNTDNGLSSDNINCIFQDRDGFMWIGTNGGLNRYDGSRTVNFSTEFNELNSFLISYVSQDSAGYIWLGTKDAGLFRYNPKNNQFLNVQKSTPETSGLSDNYVFSCVSDNNNQLWVTTQCGLVSLDLADVAENQVIIKDMTFALPKEGGVRFVLPRKNRSLLSFSAHSLTVINACEAQNIERKRLLDERVFAAKEDAYGVLWVNWVGQMYKVVEGELIADFKLIDHPLLKDGQPYDVGEINCFTFDLSGRLWIGTSENGIFSAEIDEENNTIEILSHSYLDVTKVGSLTNNMVRHLWVDKTNVLWVGTEGGGINLLDLEAQDFRNVYNLDARANSKVVRSVCEDDDENLWLGIDASGLYFLPTSENYSSEMQLITFDDKVLNDVLKSINCIYETADGIIWIGTEGRGLLSLTHDYNAQTQKLSYRLHSSPDYNNRILNGASITSILEEADGTLWIATYSTGLKRAYRNAKGLLDEVDFFRYDSDLEQSISSDIVRSLASSPDGDIWVGTGQGINKIIRQKDNDNIFFQRYLAGDVGLTNDYILPLYFTSDGDLWVGTLGGGLFYYDSKKDLFKSYSTKDGLPNDVVKSIVEDEEGMLWISSNKGLSKFDKQMHSFVNFTVADGLQSNSFNELSGVKRENGELLFGGVNGLTAFLPEEIKSNPYLSDVKLTGVKIFNREITAGEKLNGRVLLAENLMFTDELKLHHDENSLEFDFAALHYSPNYKCHIRYQLEGFDADWNYLLGGERTFKYTNLPSGDYKLILESYNDDDDKCSSVTVNLTIRSPWWMTWPAFITYFILFVSLLYLFSRFSLIKNNKKNELLLERIEKEKTDEMTQLKLDFFTKISHEFRTPLTLIIGTIDSLFGNDQTYSRKRDVIQRNVNSILRLTRQLTDFRKYEQGQLEMKVGANNIISFVHNVFDSFDSVAQQKNIDFQYVKTQENLELWFDADKIEKVLFNLISNAIKFTSAEGSVSIKVIEKKNDVEVLINDSGVGIPKQKQAHIFEMFYRADKGHTEGTGVGLAFSKNMVEMHSGDLSFHSSENQGTQFKLSLKKGKEHFSPDDFHEFKAGGDFVLDYASGREWKNPIAVTDKKNVQVKKDAIRSRLLIVEDQLEIRRFIIENLQEHYDILEASNGREGFDKCLQQLPDLVISDVIMSEMTGLELCKNIKENVTTKHIPVMLLSARDEVSDLVKGYDYEADAYVTKPFHIQVLKARVASLIKNRQRIINQTVNKVTLEPMDVNISKADERFLNRAMKVMEKNIGNTDYHVNSFAKELGFSAPHLNRKFKKLLDKTTIRFMQEVRLKRAVQLLRLGTPVSDVADETGYNSVRRFRDSFKDHYELSPSEYMSSLREE